MTMMISFTEAQRNLYLNQRFRNREFSSACYYVWTKVNLSVDLHRIPLDKVKTSTGTVVEALEQQAQQQTGGQDDDDDDDIFSDQPRSASTIPSTSAVAPPSAKASREPSQDVDREIANGLEAQDEEQEEQEEEDEEESDDDIEIILDRPAHSLDLRWVAFISP
ncbi:hypothetical protein NP233_g12884 [Leucocoprinus birnbaumii]|uniref:Uncharacterized protein n=1 Tax=Leucocoprinus birnbaumii TaxID=56174 RepID=A0AAD5YJ40_9AGAR|nr:hypothetical protein NP233_g12884 [Leucocoprinus birnbaumii]